MSPKYWFTVSTTFTFTEAAKKEYFERNFAWHAISESKGDLTANIENATIMFVRPTPDGRSKDRLGIMKTTYNLKVISRLFWSRKYLISMWIFHISTGRARNWISFLLRLGAADVLGDKVDSAKRFMAAQHEIPDMRWIRWLQLTRPQHRPSLLLHRRKISSLIMSTYALMDFTFIASFTGQRAAHLRALRISQSRNAI